MNIKGVALVLLCAVLAPFVIAVPQLSIDPSAITTNPSREFTIDIKMNTDQQVYGIQFDLAYDQNLLELVDMTEGAFLRSDLTQTYAVRRPSAGRMTFAVTRTIVRSGIAGQGAIATARFRTLRTGQSGIQLANVKIADPAIRQIEGVRATNAIVGIYLQTTTTPQPSTERRRSGGGGGSSSSSTPGSTIISSATPGEDATSPEMPKHGEKQSERIALKGGAQPQSAPVTEEQSDVTKMLFPIMFLVVLALGALAYAYKSFSE